MNRRSFCGKLMWGMMFAVAVMAQPTARGGSWVVKAGYDLFQSTTGTEFDGMPFTGVPLVTYNFGSGSVVVGNADTIIQRLSDATVPTTPGSTASVSIRIDALQLETTGNFMGMGNGNYFLVPQSYFGGPTSTGTMNITFASNAGGTFTSTLDVFFDITKGSLTGPIVYSGDLTLTNSGDTWGRTPPAGATTINGVNVNLLGDGTNNGDFWPGVPFTESHPGFGQHVVTDASSVPEPGTWFMGATAMMIGLAYAGWRRRRET
jgi:hypothetical protein